MNVTDGFQSALMGVRVLLILLFQRAKKHLQWLSH